MTLKYTDRHICTAEAMALAVSLIVYVRVFVQILVQNVPWDVTLRQLEQSFSKFGKVKVITTSFYPGTTRTKR